MDSATPVTVEDNIISPEPAHTSETSVAKPSRLATYGAVIGAVLCVVAWATLLFNEWVSGAFGVLSVAACVMGCRQPRSNMRNLAITGLVASAVLLLDILILVGLIFYLKTL